MRKDAPRGIDRWTATGAGVITLVALATGCQAAPGEARADGSESPRFEPDPAWPAELPENWILGQVAGLHVDQRDYVWIVHRPGTVDPVNAGAAQDPPIARCCVPAPPVIAFDPEGNVAHAWGHEEEGYAFPEEGHGIFVDHEDNVWVGGGNASPEVSDHVVLKFTREGEFLLQIGDPERRGDSNDTELLGGPTAMEVDPETNELYIADGYQSRRVVVFDGATGEYRRHWGAYGNAPDDDASPTREYTEGPEAQFMGPVHAVAVSNDGLVYVGDRPSNRVQVFQRDGTYVDEFFVRPETLSMGSIWDLTLSSDPEQRWIYIPDGTNNAIWIVDRESLEVSGDFGRGGRAPGQFDWIHNLGVDSQGNLYTAEVNDGQRVQRLRRTE